MYIIETWLTIHDTPIISTLNTNKVGFVHLPRPSSHFCGGRDVLYNKCIKLIICKYLYLEHSDIFTYTLMLKTLLTVIIITIYRPHTDIDTYTATATDTSTYTAVW